MDLLRCFEESGHDGRNLRPTTFWSWNDQLETEEIRRQIREMAKGGLGGHFMHARRGYGTPYLGPEWMEDVRAAVDEGRHTDVVPWLYDEDCRPSGACSGRVYAGRELYQQKYLLFEEIKPPAWEPTERTVAVYLARKEGGRYVRFRRLDDPRRACGMRPGRDEALVAFSYRFGEYVDTFNRDATEEFLKRTHEVYRDTVGHEFGRRIPGIFTDEPCYGHAGHRVPWSPELQRFFRRSSGYDLLDHLPELFFPLGDFRKTRFDFYYNATRLFLMAWTLPVYQWCERHKLKLTGHLMAEDTLRSQIEWIGAAMPHYEYMHIPGIDHVGRALGSPVLMKQVSSVAAQLDRPRVLSEMFAGAGWNASFDDLRWLAEWQFALGVNLVCQHLASYSLRGSRKRDFPPSLHYHQPWWPHYYLWSDYVARLLAVLTAGKPVADVLLLHPITSAWAEFSPLDHEAVDVLDAQLRLATEALLGMHADFHLGDPFILERHGSVSKAGLTVGACRYSTVVVPDATNLRKGTVRLLGEFKKAGGRLIFAGRVPALVDGVPSEDVERLAKGCLRAPIATAKGRAALRQAVAPKIEVLKAADKDAKSVVCSWRDAGQDQVFFFLNADAEKAVKAKIRLPVSGTPFLLNPDTGEVRRLKARQNGARTTLERAFGPRESALFVVSRDPEAAEEPIAEPEALRHSQALRGRWRIRREDPNTLVLDTACWRTDEGTYSKPMPIMDIQHDLVKRGAEEVVFLRMEFDCAIEDLKGRRFELVIEQPEAYEMWVHGMRTPLLDAGPWWDHAFRRVDITTYVRRGTNVIELKRPWFIDDRKRAMLLGQTSSWASLSAVPDVELESVYIIGDFGVEFRKGSRTAPHASRWMLGRPTLVDEPASSTGRDLIAEGYPFFVGRLTLEKEVVIKGTPSPEAVLELPPFAAITADVRVNEQEAGIVWKTPRRVPVGGLLRRGRNLVAVTLTTSLRNMLGPHHNKEGESYWVHPGSFAGTMGWHGHGVGFSGAYREDYNVVDFGLGGDMVTRY